MNTSTVWKRVLLYAFVFLFALSTIGASKASKTYDKAQDLLATGSYAEAAELFDSISGYEDSATVSMYCKAHLLAQNGDYQDAIQAFQSFGDYKDSKFCAVYYSAVEKTILGETDPYQYLEAKELFDQIKLFKDSATKAEACLEAVYNSAAEYMFDRENMYISSSIQNRDNLYIAEGLLEELEGYKNTSTYLKEIEEYLALGIRVELSQFDEEYNLLFSEEFFGKIYPGEIEEGFDPWLLFEVSTKEEVCEIEFSCTIDGDSYDFWSKTEASADSPAVFYLPTAVLSNYLEIGNHTIVFHINSFPSTLYYSVNAGVSDQYAEKKELIDLLDITTRIQIYNPATDESSENLEASTASLETLPEGQIYIPQFSIANNSGGKASFYLSALVNGKEANWGDRTLESGKTSYYRAQNEELHAGKNTLAIYIDGVLAAEQTYTITEGETE